MQGHVTSIRTIGCRIGVPVNGVLGGQGLRLEVSALVLGEFKRAQGHSFADVTFKKFLVLNLILVGLAELSWHLRVTKGLLLDWCVVLSALLVDVRETLGLFKLDS